MIYFISGHRDLTQDEFDTTYGHKIDKALENENSYFVVGDYQGADIMAQKYLDNKIKDKGRVTVFHMFDRPRHLASSEFHLMGGFKTDEERDAAMTKISDIDIAFVREGKWDSGTAQNIKRRHKLE